MPLTIDDFNTGPQSEFPLTSGSRNDFQSGTMLGGGRHVVHTVGQVNGPTPLNRKGVYTITDGHLIVEDGVHAASRLEISYGIAANGNVVPLNLDLSKDLANGQFILHFHSLDMLNEVDVIIQLVTPSREMLQISKQVTPPVIGSFDVPFPLADFHSNTSGNAPTEKDFQSIDYLTLIFQDGGNGGNDFAINLIDIT